MGQAGAAGVNKSNSPSSLARLFDADAESLCAGFLGAEVAAGRLPLGGFLVAIFIDPPMEREVVSRCANALRDYVRTGSDAKAYDAERVAGALDVNRGRPGRASGMPTRGALHHGNPAH